MVWGHLHAIETRTEAMERVPDVEVATSKPDGALPGEAVCDLLEQALRLLKDVHRLWPSMICMVFEMPEVRREVQVVHLQGRKDRLQDQDRSRSSGLRTGGAKILCRMLPIMLRTHCCLRKFSNADAM